MPQRPERPLRHPHRLPAVPGRGRLRAALRAAPAQVLLRPQGGAKAGELADLFLDPDEDGLHNAEIGSTKLLNQMSDLNGAYGDAIRRANCCVDQWWPDPASISTLCSGGCPADLTCNE